MSSPSSNNKSGSSTPRATSPSTPGVDLSSFPVPPTGGRPRPMPAIDHSIKLEGWNAMPQASAGIAPSGPTSFDSIFLRLQQEFIKLSKEQERIDAQNKVLAFREHAAKNVHKKITEAKEESQRLLEKSQRERKVVEAQYTAAVKLEAETKREKKRLDSLTNNLRLREADLVRREDLLQRRESMVQRLTGGALDAELAATGRVGGMQQSDPLSSEDEMAGTDGLVVRSLRTLFESARDDPPRDRTLSSPHILEHQLLATTSSASYGTILPSGTGQISPLRPRPVIPRRVSSANLSCATPTPFRVRSGSNSRRVSAFGIEEDSLYDSSGEEAGDDESSGGEQLEVSLAGRPRGRSVRRVSRNENLRR